MPLHLKTGDGDLPLIKEPALLTRCACISHEIYRPALKGSCDFLWQFSHNCKFSSQNWDINSELQENYHNCEIKSHNYLYFFNDRNRLLYISNLNKNQMKEIESIFCLKKRQPICRTIEGIVQSSFTHLYVVSNLNWLLIELKLMGSKRKLSLHRDIIFMTISPNSHYHNVAKKTHYSTVKQITVYYLNCKVI